MTNRKHSQQRDAILAYLKASRDHPTADMIYTAIRREYPNISLGTVYRNLVQLEEMGEIQKITMRDQPDRYDGNVTSHYHFICRECGRIYDLPQMGISAELDRKAQKGFAGIIDGHTHVSFTESALTVQERQKKRRPSCFQIQKKCATNNLFHSVELRQPINFSCRKEEKQ